MNRRFCIECGDPYNGRSDKKFCCDQCRNAFHNRRNTGRDRIIRRTNKILRDNYRILRSIDSSEDEPIKRADLLELGLKFDYITSIEKDMKGLKTFYCYDAGYRQQSEDDFVVVRREVLG